MTSRIMVRLEPELMEKLADLGRKLHVPVAILVRQAIWAQFTPTPRSRPRAKVSKTAR